MGNPFISNRQIFISFTAVLVVLCLFSIVLLTLYGNIEIGNAVIDSVLYSLIFFLVSTILWYPTRYMTIENNSIVNLVFSHLITSSIASLVWVYSGYIIILNLAEDYSQFVENSSPQRFMVGVLLFLIIIILDYLIIYYDNFRIKISEKAELSSLVKEAELKSLKYQINPHFVFNSLNSISSLTISDPEKAREMSTNLSTFLRKTLSKNDQSWVKLSEEINNIKLYLQIEKVRFHDRLEVNFDLSENCGNYDIPNMILQPIVENSIKHGVYESTEKVNVNLSCSVQGEFIFLTVTNDYDPTAVSNIGAGIGLKNIRERLSLIYDRQNLINIEKEKNIFKVILRIPIIAKAYEEKV